MQDYIEYITLDKPIREKRVVVVINWSQSPDDSITQLWLLRETKSC